MSDNTHDNEFEGEFDDGFDTDEDVRQGDLIEFLSQGTAGPDAEWASHFGVIVTANCDLAYGKHGGILSYVPIVPIPVYLRLLMFPRIIDTQVRLARNGLAEALADEPGGPTMERLDDLIELNRHSEIEEIADRLDQNGAVPGRIRCLAECVHTQHTYDPASSFKDALVVVETILQNRRKCAGNDPLKSGRLLQKELTNRIMKQLPDDCLFLARPAPVAREGYIAYLRLIREIRHDSIATSWVHERKLKHQKEEPLARRVGKLSLVYLHRLTQQMTKVFADIGLPEQYERNRDELVASEIDTWVTQATSPRDGESR